MNEFPFPKLLAFLDEEKDQVEFMKVAAEVGLGSADMELAKLLLAFQLYKAFYARIPREIKGVHKAALEEMRDLRDEIEHLAEQTASSALQTGQWAERIDQAVREIRPSEVVKALHNRLLDETTAALGGSIQAIAAAYGRIDIAAGKLGAAANEAETSIRIWQTLDLRRLWLSNFALCLILTPAMLALLRLLNFAYDTLWNHIHEYIHIP
jgi:hypothetical protein